MNKFLFLTLISLISSKIIILVGDTHFFWIAGYCMKFQFSNNKVCSTSPKKYYNDYIQVTAEIKASSSHYVKGREIYTSLHNQLSKTPQDTIVLLWLGIYEVFDAGRTFDFYKTLAQMYRGLKFKAISITGVKESKTHIKNYQVERFNEQMEAKISSSHLSNLEYVNILNGNDVNSIVVGGKKIDLTKYIQKMEFLIIVLDIIIYGK